MKVRIIRADYDRKAVVVSYSETISRVDRPAEAGTCYAEVMSGLRPRKRKCWWWRVPAPMAFQRYATAAAICWGMVAFMALRDDAANWTRWVIVGAILTMACAFSWALAIISGERALFRSFQQRRPFLLSGKSASQASAVG